MTGRRASFKQADASRALRAAIAAGLQPDGYTITPDGSITVRLNSGVRPSGENSFDEILRRSQ
jgi:hypothetical protein